MHYRCYTLGSCEPGLCPKRSMDRLEHANRSDFHCARAVRRLLKVTKSEKCTSVKKSPPVLWVGSGLVSSPDPTHYARKGLVTFEGFLGCAHPHVRKCVLIINLYTIRRKCHMIAESAQPRNPSNVLSRVVGGVWARD